MQAGDAQIARTAGGVQNNVIAAEAQATLWVRPDDIAAVEQAMASLAADLKHEFRNPDPAPRITTNRSDARVERIFSNRAAANLIRTIALLPNGITNQNLEVPGNWETSNNIGLMTTTETGVEIICTITSAVTSRKHAVLDQMLLLADAAGGGVRAEQIGLDAPEFPWNPKSYMLEVAKKSYQRVLGKEPQVEVSQLPGTSRF